MPQSWGAFFCSCQKKASQTPSSEQSPFGSVSGARLRLMPKTALTPLPLLSKPNSLRWTSVLCFRSIVVIPKLLFSSTIADRSFASRPLTG